MEPGKLTPAWRDYCRGYRDAGIDCGLILNQEPAKFLMPPSISYANGYRAGLEAMAEGRWADSMMGAQILRLDASLTPRQD